MKIIYVNFHSRFTNNIFQYIYAVMLHDKLKDNYKLIFSNKCIIKAGKDHRYPKVEVNTNLIPIFNFIKKNREFKYIQEYYGYFSSDEDLKKIKSNVNFNVDLEKLEEINIEKDIVLSGFFHDLKYYKDKKPYIKDKLKHLLRTKINNVLDNDDVVIHIRTTDLSYRQYSLNYYKKCINSNKFKRIFIVTDDINHDYVKKIKEMYKNVIILTKLVKKRHENTIIINDFLHLYNAKNIIMSVSTFSWFGAWISDAKRIYYPYEDRIFRYLHVNEKRYIYVDKRNKFKEFKDIKI